MIKKYRKSILAICLFAIVALSEMMFYIHGHRLILVGDQYYHLEYLHGLSLAIKHGVILPHFNFWTMDQNGSACFTFYPYLTIEPIALIYSVIKWSITSQYLIFSAYIFIGMIISYYASRKELKGQGRRITFTIFYGTTNALINDSCVRGDLNEFVSAIFLPLVIFGAIALIKSGKWKELAIGLSLMAYSHVISAILAGILSAVIIIMNIKQVKIKSIIKCVLCATMLSIYAIGPIIYLMAKNNIYVPNVLDNPTRKPPLVNIIYFIGIPSIVAVIIGIMNHKHLGRYGWQMIGVDIIFMIAQTRYMPWRWLGNPIWLRLQVPQIPQRLLMFIGITSALIVAKYLGKLHAAEAKIIIMIILCISCQWFIQYNFTRTIQHMPARTELTTNIFNKNAHTNQKYIVSRQIDKTDKHQSKVTVKCYADQNHQIKYIYNSTYPDMIYKDYYTRGTNYQKLQSDNQKGIHFHRTGNGSFTFNDPQKPQALPIDKYHGVNYRVKISKRHANIQLGHNYIFPICGLISLGTLISILGTKMKHRYTYAVR